MFLCCWSYLNLMLSKGDVNLVCWEYLTDYLCWINIDVFKFILCNCHDLRTCGAGVTLMLFSENLKYLGLI